ncbi:hypothetical protein [Terrarubrum flagellatum]|uniref:hypothetical protein n=1 Tax=Terrirubrum flagellatum TaxID=2895980 RepID=UPI00314553A2
MTEWQIRAEAAEAGWLGEAIERNTERALILIELASLFQDEFGVKIDEVDAMSSNASIVDVIRLAREEIAFRRRALVSSREPRK